MRISVCVVTNRFFDEEYITEWCEHYYRLGFDYIYVLEDLNGRDGKFMDMPYMAGMVESGKMEIEQIPHMNQYDTYPAFYRMHGGEFDWCAIFDSDEFLTLCRHGSIQEFLAQDLFADADVVTVNWRNHGDNGQTHKTDGMVVDRFPEVGHQNPRVETKLIIRGGLERTEFFIGHCCVANGNPQRTKFCDGTPYDRMDPFHRTDYGIAALDHYYTKSTEEFIRRKSYGRLDAPWMSRHKALQGFMDSYFRICERTPEKERMFREALDRIR